MAWSCDWFSDSVTSGLLPPFSSSSVSLVVFLCFILPAVISGPLGLSALGCLHVPGPGGGGFGEDSRDTVSRLSLRSRVEVLTETCSPYL